MNDNNKDGIEDKTRYKKVNLLNSPDGIIKKYEDVENEIDNTELIKTKSNFLTRVFLYFKKLSNLLFRRKSHSKELYSIDDSIDHYSDTGLKSDIELSKSNLLIRVIAIFFLIIFVWAYFGKIDEVTKGTGVVIPGPKEQVIQSPDGGVLESLYVREGDIVQKNQILARMDAVRARSNLDEAYIKYYIALASTIRLKAQLADMKIQKLQFPKELEKYPELIKSQKYLYHAEINKLNETIENLNKNIAIIKMELEINKRLLSQGANSQMDVLKLEAQLIELHSRKADTLTSYQTHVSQELTKALAELDSIKEQLPGKQDLVNKSIIRSPVKGIVKDIQLTTIGGAVPANGKLMGIVPLGDVLLVEAKLSPRDIAFIHPGQKAKVKITAYDYAIYGGLDGEVLYISPDTLKEENSSSQKNTYYKVYIRTKHDYLENKKGKKFYISPGMIAQVKIQTGSRTILQYLIKPFNKLNEALRER